MQEPLLLKIHQAAAIANNSRTTAYELCASGVWPTVRFGRAVRVHARLLHEWIEKNAAGENGGCAG